MRKLTFVKRVLATALCATITITSFSIGASQVDAATPRSEALIQSGKQYLGVPYRLGAPSGATYAFDCSSFTQYLFKKNGVTLPRTSAAQATKGTSVAKGYLSMGDLVFFKTNGRSISHVGVYAGQNKMLHTSSSQGVVITNMNTSYWNNRYVTARRVLN
ncbi:C40 family peptidase [Paenibacillus sp. 1P07SE]|uniref:C40 family peptidase n=1 Tax=Paenibacillus sp. 1P07SE TaxID=3132209 RepID=UPI0039A3FFAF